MTVSSTLRTAALSGAAAGVLSAATTAAMQRLDAEKGMSSAANPRRWVSRHAAREQVPANRNSLVNVIARQLKSVLWAAIYSRVFRRQVQEQSIPQQVLGGVASAATAYLVDYALTPKRSQPRSRRYSSSRGRIATYAAVGVGVTLLGAWIAMKSGKQ